MRRAMLHTFHIPEHDNDGRPQSPDELRRVREELALFAGGCTVSDPGDGLWIPQGPGGLCCEPMRLIHVVASIGPDTDRWIAHYAARMAARLRQEEIFVYRTPVSVVQAADLADVRAAG
jgi:hypothetical protein